MRKRVLQLPGKRLLSFFVLLQLSAITVFAQSLKSYLDSARKFASAGDTMEVYYLSKAILLEPKNPTLYELRAYAYTFANLPAEIKLEKAIADLDQALKLNPSNAIYYQQRGYFESKAGQYKKALKDLDLAIKINPVDASSYRIRGDIQWDRINYLNALMDFRSCSRLDSTQIYCLRKWADCQYTIYNFTRAAEIYTTVIRKTEADSMRYNEDLLLSYIYKGHSLFNHNFLIEAIACYDKAIWYNNRFRAPVEYQQESYRFRGLAKIQQGKSEAGCEDLHMASKYGDSSAESLINSFCPNPSK
jgi:tetratricopeptide (TPR) repeat protein